MHQRQARLIAWSFGAAALLLSLAGHGQTTLYGPFSLTSTSGTQLSNVIYTINVSTTGPLSVEYTASAGHCSDVRMHFLVDGVERALSGFLTPGQSTGFVNVGPVTPGAHVVGLQAEGRVGGCNTGALVGWGGTAQVTVAALAAASAVPAPGWIATALLFLGGIALFGPWRAAVRARSR